MNITDVKVLKFKNVKDTAAVVMNNLKKYRRCFICDYVPKNTECCS